MGGDAKTRAEKVKNPLLIEQSKEQVSTKWKYSQKVAAQTQSQQKEGKPTAVKVLTSPGTASDLQWKLYGLENRTEVVFIAGIGSKDDIVVYDDLGKVENIGFYDLGFYIGALF